MNKFLKMLLVVLICVAGIGFYRGWFSVSSHSPDAEHHKVDLSLTVDGDKVKADAETVKEKAVELAGEAKQEASTLGDQAKDKSEKD